jgi:hypothetical protein
MCPLVLLKLRDPETCNAFGANVATDVPVVSIMLPAISLPGVPTPSWQY